MDPLTFTAEELAGQVNRYAAIDRRILPRIGKGGAHAKKGKCSRCGEPSGPYSLCRLHRERGSIKRVVDKLVKEGHIERLTDGRGKKDGALYRMKKKVPFVRGAAKIGRNDPCPCGSDKKFKHCCNAQAQRGIN